MNNPFLVDVVNDTEIEFYTDCNGRRCSRPRGAGAAQRKANRAAKRLERFNHYQAVLQDARKWMAEQ